MKVMSKKRPAISPKINMPKKSVTVTQSSQRSKFETSLDLVVKIELISINDKPYYGQISDDELMYIWVQVFKRSKDELFGAIGTKSLNRLVRATYKLRNPTKLRDITKTEEFSYEKFLDEGRIEVVRGRFLGFNSQKPVEIGQKAIITVKTNFGVEADGVTNWLQLYGTVYSQSFVKNETTGLMTDIIEAEMVLKAHIPEYLPIYGQKCLVNYPGIPKLCNKCYTFDHFRRECRNKEREWIEYVIQLTTDQKISHELKGTWKNAIQRWEKANADVQDKDETL